MAYRCAAFLHANRMSLVGLLLAMLVLGLILVPAFKRVNGKGPIAEGDVVASVLADALRHHYRAEGDIPFDEDECSALTRLGSYLIDAEKEFRARAKDSKRKFHELGTISEICGRSVYCNSSLEDAKRRGLKLIFVWTERVPIGDGSFGYYPCIDLEFHVRRMYTTVQPSGISVEDEWLDIKPFPGTFGTDARTE